MAATHYHCPSSLVLRSSPSIRLVQNLKLKTPSNSLLGVKIRVRSCSVSVRPPVSAFFPRPVSTMVSSSIPTPNPDGVPPGKEIHKWSFEAIKSIAMAAMEARKLRFATTGTEALIMGVLIEGTNLANKFLRANGMTLFKVRDEIAKVIGSADVLAKTPERPPLTDDALRALDWAVDKNLKSVDGGEITPAHIILGIWSEVDSSGHKILSNLGFDDEKAKELESYISKAVVKDE